MTSRRFLMSALAALVAHTSVLTLPSHTQDDDTPPRVTLAFVDTDLRDALRLVGRQCNVNMVVSNGVTGKITLELQGTSLEETLEAIALVGGLRYRRDGNMIVVQSLAEILEERRRQEQFDPPPLSLALFTPETLVLELRHVDAERIEPIIQSLLSDDGKVTILKTSDHVAQERSKAATDGGTGTELEIGSRLSTSTQGEPARSHTLVVLDSADRIARIREVIARIDVKPAQVEIEARFVEITLDEDDRSGIDWNVIARMNGGAVPHTGPFGSSTLGSLNPKVVSGSPSGIFPAVPDTVTTRGEPGLFTFGTLDFTAFSALLEMIERDSDTQTVSNPRIAVRDRHTATILVGERYPILSANISEFGSVTEQLDHYEPVGVQLAVTPSVLGGEVELTVRPSISSLGADVEGSTGLAVARINSRQIDTSVTVKDGQTLVIGGLISTREVDTQSRVPIVGSIPVLGRLFRHDAKRKERVNLVVFLTVTISQENGLTPEQRRLFDETTPDAAVPEEASATRRTLEFVPSRPQH